MSKFYTGIGSRATPSLIQDDMVRLGAYLGQRGWTLRSGAARGSDTAFEIGAQGYKSEIWLPWKGFNAHSSPLYMPKTYLEVDPHWLPYGRQNGTVIRCAVKLASEIHPRWNALDDTSRRFHIRNIFQVLGKKLDEQSAFVVCWTPSGEAVGGTRTAIVLAESLNIPVFNLAKMSLDDVIDSVNELVVDAVGV